MKIICDTHVLIFWAVDPGRLSRRASSILEEGYRLSNLACSDITWWEIAMLFARGRFPQIAQSPAMFMNDLIEALNLHVLPITPEIAALSQSNIILHKDPADRLITATALYHQAPLITVDEKLHRIPGLTVIWD